MIPGSSKTVKIKQQKKTKNIGYRVWPPPVVTGPAGQGNFFDIFQTKVLTGSRPVTIILILIRRQANGRSEVRIRCRKSFEKFNFWFDGKESTQYYVCFRPLDDETISGFFCRSFDN
jgi:hypothetical protein